MNIKAQATTDDYVVVVTVELIERQHDTQLETVLANVNDELKRLVDDVVKAARGDYKRLRGM